MSYFVNQPCPFSSPLLPPNLGVNNVAEGAEMLGGGVACVDQDRQVW